jgi:hypothetical protein
VEHTASQTPRCLLGVISISWSTGWWTRKNNWKKGWRRRRKKLSRYSGFESQKGHKELIHHMYIDGNTPHSHHKYFKLKYENISDEKLQ